MTAAQLGLFDEPIIAPTPTPWHQLQRHRPALVCLRDAVPEALQVVHELRNWCARDTRSPCASGDWAYCISNAGLRYEPTSTWWRDGAWDRSPQHLLPWTDLATLIDDDPRRTQIATWVESLPWPRWKTLTRPHELWPHPGSWHISYLCHDHLDTSWPARRHAWQLVLELLTDTIGRLA